jgi:hypothetical protein
MHKRCKALYKPQRGEVPPGVDPHKNTLQATFSLDEYVALVRDRLASPTELDARDLSMTMCMAQMAGRGDDMRWRLVSELYEPYARRSIGAHHT